MGGPSRRRVLLASGLAVALVSCSSTPGPGPAPAPAPDASAGSSVAALRALPFTEATVDGFASVLERSGVEVVEGFDSTATAPVRVTRWQAENMAAEVANGGGPTGRTLDSLVPVPQGAPPLPFLVVAWMQQGATPGARFAHALYEGQDLANAFEVRFPDGVLALFLADATAGGGAPAVTASPALVTGGGTVRAVPAAAHADLTDAPCSTVSHFVQDALAAVATALTIKTTGGGFAGFLAAIWNTAVQLASRFVSGLIETLTRPVVAQLVAVLNAVAAVQQVASVLIAWRAPLTPTPETTRFGVVPEEVTGEVVMQLQPHVLPAPDAVRDCASSVGVDISATAAGSGVTWTTEPTPRVDLATTTSADKALDATESATLRYRTGQEPQDALEEPPRTGTFAVSATMRRNDVERLRQLISQLLLAQVPTSLRSLVESIAGPILNAATARLAELTDVHSRSQVPVTFHGAADQCRKGRIAAGTYVAPVEKDLRAAGGVTGHTSGTVTLVVDAAGRVTGTIDVVSDARGGGYSGHATERSRISGPTAAPVVTLVERIVDGADLTTPNSTTTPAMRGLCPPAIRWNLASLAPGVQAMGGWDVVATPVRRPSSGRANSG